MERRHEGENAEKVKRVAVQPFLLKKCATEEPIIRVGAIRLTLRIKKAICRTQATRNLPPR